jgi:hypothetical protein
MDFAWYKDAKFTLREWALTTGGYEWTLPDVSQIKCFNLIGVPFDDGRYRQVSF